MGVDFIYPSHINLPNSNFHELILSWFESLVKVIWFTIIALKRLPFLMNWNFCYTFCKHISGQQLEYKLQFLNRKVMMLSDILNFCNAWWKGKAYLKLDQTMPIFSKSRNILLCRGRPQNLVAAVAPADTSLQFFVSGLY